MGGIALTQREPALVTPFWVRIATESSLSPGWLLVAFPAVLYPTYLLLEALFGRGLAAATDFGSDWEAQALLMVATSLGYISMMAVYVAQGAFRDLEALRPVLKGGEPKSTELRQQLIRFDRGHLWAGGLIALAFFAVLQETSFTRWTRLLAGEWSLHDAFSAVIFASVWIVAGRMAASAVDSARVYSKIGEHHVEIDLLDLAPVAPLTRYGLRIVLLLAILTAAFMTISIFLVLSVSSPPAVAVLLPCVCNLAVATAAFLLPVRGLRRHIRARKTEKLSQLRGEIRRDEELIATLAPESAEASTRLPALLAFEKRIESVREWPFDAPTLTRFFLYVAIPLGSWVGGALVERLLGAALD